MKKYLIQSIRLTAVLMVLLCVIYPLVVAFAGSFSAGGGSGEKITRNGKVIGYTQLGQSFTRPEYFWGRPSGTGYQADGSAGSNKGPSNAAYLQQVSQRIAVLLESNPGLKKADIPADLVTASGSGLDPDLSVQGAAIQIRRVAVRRGLEEKTVTALVARSTKKPFLGLFGPSRVNVLQLNLALDQMKRIR